jgi:hypothetical protein
MDNMSKLICRSAAWFLDNNLWRSKKYRANIILHFRYIENDTLGISRFRVSNCEVKSCLMDVSSHQAAQPYRVTREEWRNQSLLVKFRHLKVSCKILQHQ